MNENDSIALSGTNWERLRTMSDDEIDTSDIPPLSDEFFQNAKIRFPPGKVPLLLNVDEEIADWFRRQDGRHRRVPLYRRIAVIIFSSLAL